MQILNILMKTSSLKSYPQIGNQKKTGQIRELCQKSISITRLKFNHQLKE